MTDASDIPARAPEPGSGSLDLPNDDEPETPLERGRYDPGAPRSLDDEDVDTTEPTPSPDATPLSGPWSEPQPA